MRMGAAMPRFDSNLYPIGLIMVAVLSLGLMVVRNTEPAEKGGRVITVSEHSEARTHTTPENGGRVTLDIGVADLRGSLP